MAKARSLLLVPAGASLLLGLDGALSRLALTPIIGVGAAAEAHGMVMVLGFLGTVIALERAVALRRGWAYAAPILLAGGMLVFLAGAPSLGRWLLIDGMAIFVGVYLALWRRQRDALTAIQALAAVMGLVAAICWFNFEIAQVLPLLVGFIVLTIASERLELARFQLPKNAPSVLIWFSAGLGVAATVSVTGAGLATRAFAVGLLALALWLLTNDVAVENDQAHRAAAVQRRRHAHWLRLANRRQRGMGLRGLCVWACQLRFRGPRHLLGFRDVNGASPRPNHPAGGDRTAPALPLGLLGAADRPAARPACQIRWASDWVKPDLAIRRRCHCGCLAVVTTGGHLGHHAEED